MRLVASSSNARPALTTKMSPSSLVEIDAAGGGDGRGAEAGRRPDPRAAGRSRSPVFSVVGPEDAVVGADVEDALVDERRAGVRGAASVCHASAPSRRARRRRPAARRKSAGRRRIAAGDDEQIAGHDRRRHFHLGAVVGQPPQLAPGRRHRPRMNLPPLVTISVRAAVARRAASPTTAARRDSAATPACRSRDRTPRGTNPCSDRSGRNQIAVDHRRARRSPLVGRIVGEADGHQRRDPAATSACRPCRSRTALRFRAARR